MTGKTSNVAVRVEPEIKAQAEQILTQLGISASTAINMFYRQIIYRNGLPFCPTISAAPKAREELSRSEFDTAMATGLSEAKANQSVPVDEAFDRLLGALTDGTV